MFDCSTRAVLAIGFTLSLACAAAVADEDQSCAGLPSHHQLQTALESARDQSNGGFNLDMWGTVVNRDGVVCEVAFTGANRGSQWPGSRAISAQKANTANAFSLPGLALSTADLYAAVQPEVRSTDSSTATPSIRQSPIVARRPTSARMTIRW